MYGAGGAVLAKEHVGFDQLVRLFERRSRRPQRCAGQLHAHDLKRTGQIV
jgi:hypothetical protein